MLQRKIASVIERHLSSPGEEKILLVDGARQVGKTYIIRHVGKKLFENFIEIDLVEDSLGDRLFAEARTAGDFYLRLGMIAGDRMGERGNTLVFLDEIQAYPHLLTLLKFLRRDRRFTYIASGSLLGVTLSQTPSIPMGSLEKIRMFPLDLEEFLWANGVGRPAIGELRGRFARLEPLDGPAHGRMTGLFRKFLLAGGMPEAVDVFVRTGNIQAVRKIQGDIRDFYAADASKYDRENRLKIRRVYDMIPSNMENRKKRVVAKRIEGRRGKTFADYGSEFEYLIAAGIALDVRAISNPVFPLIQSAAKNLLKLYLNDVGILSGILYGNNIQAVLNDERSVNLGAVYETAVAGELAARGRRLFYYDNRANGEVDYLVDDFDSLSVVPIEVKSGRDYSVHSALTKLTANPGYPVRKAYVLSNRREIAVKGKIVYVPIYDVMFL